MKIDITDDEIEAIRITTEWGVVDGSWAHSRIVEFYNKIVKEQERLHNERNSTIQRD